MTSQYKVIIPKTVKRDIDEIIAYYFQDRRSYALKVFTALFNKVSSLKSFPEKGRVVPELRKHNVLDYREVIESYYRIIYRIEGHKVFLLTVIDGRRNVEDLLIQKLRRTANSRAVGS